MSPISNSKLYVQCFTDFGGKYNFLNGKTKGEDRINQYGLPVKTSNQWHEQKADETVNAGTPPTSVDINKKPVKM